MKTVARILIVVVAIGIAACEMFISDSDRVSKAKEFMTAGDFRGSFIELRKVLEHDKNNGEAHYLLARLYIISHEGVKAEAELSAIPELGRSQGYYQLLEEAFILEGKYDDGVKYFSTKAKLKDVDEKDNFKLYLADLLFLQGKFDQANEVLETEIQQYPNYDGAYALLARIALETGKLKTAQEYINKVSSKESLPISAQLVVGDILTAQNKYEDAEAVYSTMLDEVAPENLSPRQQFRAMNGLINAKIMLSKYEPAMADIDKFIKTNPNSPYPRFLKGWVLFQTKDYDRALQVVRVLSNDAPDFMPAQLLQGAIQYMRGNYEQAKTSLMQFVMQNPEYLLARKLLAATELKLERPADALDVLKPAMSGELNDAEVFLLANQAASSLNYRDAQFAYLKKAQDIDPSNKAIKSEMVRLFVNNGDYDAAVKEIEAYSSAGDKSFNDKAYLVMQLLSHNNLEKARGIVSSMKDEYAHDPRFYILTGQIELESGNKLAATEQLRHSLKIDNNYVPALLLMGKIDIEDGNLDQAENQYRAVLDRQSVNSEAMIGMARIEAMRGNVGGSVSWLTKASEANPSDITSRIILSRYYSQSGDLDRAMIMANEAMNIQPKNPVAVSLRAHLDMVKGDIRSAISLLEKLAVMYPESIQGHIELANSYLAGNEYQHAINEAEKAIKLDDTNILARIILAKAWFKYGNTEKSLEMARQIAHMDKNSSIGYILEGDIELSGTHYSASLNAYQSALQIKGTPLIYIKLSRIHELMQNWEQAKSIIQTGIRKFPGNSTLRIRLAEIYQIRNELDSAEQQYRYILDEHPENIIALNNLAFIYLDEDRDKALAYAKKAYDIMPDNPAVSDTLGWILLQSGRSKDALTYLEKAAHASTNPTIDYHFARALLKNGQNNRARDELQKIMASGVEFAEKSQAISLLDTLRD